MNIGGYKAIDNAINMDDFNSLCLDMILVHIPFVLKNSIMDATLVDKNNLPHDLCYKITLRYVLYYLLNEEPKVGLWSSINNVY